MEQSSEDSLDNRSGMNYSEEMLSLMRSMHSFMQAREEREATILQSNSDPAHPAPALVTAQPISSFQVASDPSVPSSPHVQAVPVAEPTSTQAGAHLAQAPDPPNNTLPAQASDPPANNLTSELNFLYEAISDLHHAVTGSEKKITQGTKNGPFKPRRFGLKKDPTTRDPLAGM
ncbi:hypothetical protein BDP27DRAFT_394508 [Rhodocollybia butyracea]|uniref:Uncharacterized protein n=1 Tax=Rhodocollybia butyracea TaxID=206335 RepID=A0A9P5PCD9_9AGAR|nr:hypothetical protein BDP27DRAFT_394508 [Rhodocollybia butyracea]